jgi:endonuclease G
MRESRWVEYRLTKSELVGNKSPRTNVFLADPEITTTRVTPKDYYKSGYDKGHMAPAEDMAYDRTSEAECFYMTNMIPQLPGCNRGIWKKLETLVRSWAMKDTDLIVFTGPVLGPVSKTIGVDKVMVPASCYKLIMDPTSYVCFVIPNSSSQAELKTFEVSVDSLSKLTGINFRGVVGTRNNNWGR